MFAALQSKGCATGPVALPNVKHVVRNVPDAANAVASIFNQQSRGAGTSPHVVLFDPPLTKASLGQDPRLTSEMTIRSSTGEELVVPPELLGTGGPSATPILDSLETSLLEKRALFGEELMF